MPRSTPIPMPQETRPRPAPSRRWAMQLAVCIAALALTGCASLRTISSEVTSYAQWPGQRAPGSFAFDRLPSQEARAEAHASLEQAAASALQGAGFSPAADAANADVLVQIGARVGRVAYPWEDRFGWPYGLEGPWGHRPYARSPWWGPLHAPGWRFEPPRYEREVALLIRDRRTGAALYETRASNDGTGAFTPALMAAMYEAAMKGFPSPPSGARAVRVEMPAAVPASR
jgi:hypothetical protein